MLWAFSTAGRADPYFFEVLTDRLVSCMEHPQDKHRSGKISKHIGSGSLVAHPIKPQVRLGTALTFALRIFVFRFSHIFSRNFQIVFGHWLLREYEERINCA